MNPESDNLPRAELTAYCTSPYAPELIPAPFTRDWMDSAGGGFAYRCLPMLIANQSGWLILNNFSITATWSGLEGKDAVRIEYGDGATPPIVSSHFGSGILTWNLPMIFRTSPGYNLLVRGPANLPKDAVFPLEGIVETDWASATFTMNWKITRAHTPIRFDVGEPICMIVPQLRGQLERFQPNCRAIDCCPELQTAHYEWSKDRKRYLEKLAAGNVHADDPGWQRHYFQGRHVRDDASANFAEHQTRLRLRPFEES